MPKLAKPPIPVFLDIKTVAARLTVSPRTVTRWIDQGELVTYKIGGLVRVSEDDLQQMLTRGRRTVAQDT